MLGPESAAKALSSGGLMCHVTDPQGKIWWTINPRDTKRVNYQRCHSSGVDMARYDSRAMSSSLEALFLFMCMHVWRALVMLLSWDLLAYSPQFKQILKTVIQAFKYFILSDKIANFAPDLQYNVFIILRWHSKQKHRLLSHLTLHIKLYLPGSTGNQGGGFYRRRLNCVVSQTMIGLQQMIDRASVPDLLMAVARAQEYSNIKLRRGEKKVLNAINKSVSEEKIRYCVPRPENRDKAKERINTGPEKIFILVRFSFFVTIITHLLRQILDSWGNAATMTGFVCLLWI